MTRESYTVPDAAEATGMSAKFIDRATKAQDAKRAGIPLLPSKRAGSRRLILADDLREWLRSLPDA